MVPRANVRGLALCGFLVPAGSLTMSLNNRKPGWTNKLQPRQRLPTQSYRSPADDEVSSQATAPPALALLARRLASHPPSPPPPSPAPPALA